MIKISTRAANTPASAVRKLVPLANKAKKRGISVYHLNIGQPDLPTPPQILQYLKKFNHKILEYAPSTGILETREGWQKLYQDKGLKFDVKDINITSGGSEGLIFAFFTVADPGSELIVFEPFYTSYAIIAAMGNIKLVPLRTRAKDGFHLPPKDIIEKAITSKTRGIVVCNPNNPTGTVYTDSEVTTLADLALKHNLFIISDEPYQDLVFSGSKILPFASFEALSNQLIIVDSVSKRFNACGARVGVVVCRNSDVMSSVLRFAQSRLSVATVEQLAVVSMLRNHKKYVNSIKKIYEQRRNTVVSELRKIDGVKAIPPDGAFYIMPQIPVSDSDDFAAFLLNDFSDSGETVMVAPATGFYATKGLGMDEIRIAYVLEDKKIKKSSRITRIGTREI